MTPLDAIRRALDASHGSAKAFQAELAAAGHIVVSAERTAAMLDALRLACRQFRTYQALHLAKETPEAMEKARTNGDLAKLIEAVLHASPPQSAAEPAPARNMESDHG